MSSTYNSSPLLVVAAVIRENGRYLVTQRTPDDSYPLAWEFPGGKINPGESPEEALVRECKEELGCEIEVLRIKEVMFYSYPNMDVLLLFYNCQIRKGKPRILGVHQISWQLPEELKPEEFLPADKNFIAKLKKNKE